MCGANIYEWAISNSGMISVRSCLIESFNFFGHLTPKSNLPSIRRKGLEPRNPGGVVGPTERAVLGDDAEKILCLSPIGYPISIGKPGPLIAIAISSENIPARIGLDWSYPQAYSLASIIVLDSPEKRWVDVIVESFCRRGSIALYDPIPVDQLLALPVSGDLGDPTGWPKLVDIDDDAIFEIPNLIS